MGAGLATVELDPETCPHRDLRFLRSLDEVGLLECRDCGRVLATIEGLLWPIASRSGPENQDFCF